jgi:hypothetical protein
MRERVMPLERAKVGFLGTGLQGMGFLMRDGTKEVPCRVSIEALSYRGAVTGLDEAGVFATYRDEIEHAASAKYDRGQISPDGRVYVTSDEFPNQPPR